MATNNINKQQTIHTFTKGMNMDLDHSLRSNDMYYSAENMRLAPSVGTDNKILKNINGLRSETVVSIEAGQYIIGSCSIRNYLVLFTTNSTGTESHLYRCEVSVAGAITSIRKIYDDTLNESGSLDFSLSKKIKAVGRYENATNIKVYWTDTVTPTKFANIAGDITVNGGNYVITTNDYIAVDRLEFTPNALLPELELADIISGSLTTGVVQYSYQFYTNNSSETIFAPLTQPIPITAAGYADATDLKFYGSDAETQTGIGFTLYLDNTNTGYNRVRLIAVHYESLNGTPTIRIADERQISTDGGDVYLYDTGESQGEYTLEEFSIAANNIFIAKDLEEKDNMLFAANITEEYFDVDYDARAYRFTGAEGDIADENAYNYNSSYNRVCKIFDKLGNYYLGDGTDPDGDWEYYTNADVAVPANDKVGWDNIPEDFDCINKYNDIDNDDSFDYRFIYQSDGERVGGEGPNVSYHFEVEPIEIDSDTYAYSAIVGKDTALNFDPLNKSYTNYASPFISSKLRGWLRDETYRCGIVFIDSKGRESFVKWIGDIRVPNSSDRDSVDVGGIDGIATQTTFKTISQVDSDGKIYGNVLYPVFTVTLPADVSGYRIVYVKRELKDRSILGQGIISPTALDVPNDYYEAIDYDTALTDIPLNRFYSPEVSFNRNIQYNSGDIIQVVSRVASADRTNETGLVNIIYSKIKNVSSLRNTDNTSSTYNIRGTIHYRDVKEALLSTITDAVVYIDGNAYNNYDHDSPYSYGGTSFVISPDTPANWYPVSHNTYKYIVNYKRNVFSSQYGGNTYADRSLNQYIAASPFTTTTTAKAYYGDTFICYFDVLTLVTDLSTDTTDIIAPVATRMETLCIPVETSINIPYRRTLYWPKLQNSSVEYENMVQEGLGLPHTDSANHQYTQETNLYDYNSVYSQSNIIDVYFSKPLDFTATQTFDTRIKNSETKINGEAVDSWTKFATNNYIEVDTEYGPVNNIIKFVNKLFYFQDTGFGIVSVNQRSLISDSNPGGLVLGTGGVLDRYDYVSEFVGNTNRFGIAATTGGLYWLDNNKSEIYKFSDSLQVLSYVKGIKSYLSKFDGIEDVVVAYDDETNEVLLSILGFKNGICSASNSGGFDVTFDNLDVFADRDYAFPIGVRNFMLAPNVINYATLIYPNIVRCVVSDAGYSTNDPVVLYFKQTISFSEPDDVFVSFFRLFPDLYHRTPYGLFSTYSETTAFGRLNKGVKLNSRVNVLSSENYIYTKVYDNISLLSNNTTSAGIDLSESTFTSFRVRDSYQNTDWKTLTTTPTTSAHLGIERRERLFNFAIPRNVLKTKSTSNPDILDPANLDVTLQFKDRIRDKYCMLEFKHSASGNNNNFSVSYITNKYRISYR